MDAHANSKQVMLGCDWLRRGYRIAGVEEQFQPEAESVCTRGAERRNVTADDCAGCVFWRLAAARSLDQR